VTAAAQKAPEVKKEPKKEFNNNTWYIENWGKDVLKFTSEEEV